MLNIFQYDFMVRAMVAGLMIAMIAPVIGTLLVFRRYSYLSDTLAHVSLVGVAVALILGLHPTIGAIAASVTSAIGMEWLRRVKGVFSDSVLAIFLPGSLALAVVLVSAGDVAPAQMFRYLFGSITTVTAGEVLQVFALCTMTLVLFLIFRRPLFLVAFDEELARAEGMRASWYSLMIVVPAAVVISVAIRVVGALLIGALMIMPVMSAMQFGRSFQRTISLAVIFSVCATLIGLYLSYILDLASGGVIVLVALCLFLISVLAGKRT